MSKCLNKSQYIDVVLDGQLRNIERKRNKNWKTCKTFFPLLNNIYIIRHTHIQTQAAIEQTKCNGLIVMAWSNMYRNHIANDDDDGGGGAVLFPCTCFAFFSRIKCIASKTKNVYIRMDGIKIDSFIQTIRANQFLCFDFVQNFIIKWLLMLPKESTRINHH